jgi:hypothetical protein
MSKFKYLRPKHYFIVGLMILAIVAYAIITSY